MIWLTTSKRDLLYNIFPNRVYTFPDAHLERTSRGERVRSLINDRTILLIQEILLLKWRGSYKPVTPTVQTNNKSDINQKLVN